MNVTNSYKKKWTDAQWREAFAESLSVVSACRIEKLIREVRLRLANNYIEWKTIIIIKAADDGSVMAQRYLRDELHD